MVAAVLLLLFTSDNSSSNEQEIDKRITLRRKDKIPYGASLAFDGLQYIFPNASISVSNKEPGDWDSLSVYNSGQALLIISPHFHADGYEMKKLIRFAENGNEVFISTRNLSYEAQRILELSSSPISTSDVMYNSSGQRIADALVLKLSSPPFSNQRSFTYSGEKFNAWAFNTDTSLVTPLGTDEMGRTNFIHLRAGKGNIFLQLAPLAFSNYFLLQKDNQQYYENALSLISPTVKKVVWDEYYLTKRDYFDQSNKDSKGWMSVLFKFPSLKWALLTAMAALLFYVLMEMRRRQRYIPVVSKPRNDSMEFVKTIGRLYFDKGDHMNLCRKMAAYFLEHVRNRYKLPTTSLDEEFVRKLQFKSGYDYEQLNGIIAVIRSLTRTEKISEKGLISFHRKLETFYKNT